jgi:hypothetical protein
MEIRTADPAVVHLEHDVTSACLGFWRIDYRHFILTLECGCLHFFTDLVWAAARLLPLLATTGIGRAAHVAIEWES